MARSACSFRPCIHPKPQVMAYTDFGGVASEASAEGAVWVQYPSPPSTPPHPTPGPGFRAQGSGFRVQGSGFRVSDSRFYVHI